MIFIVYSGEFGLQSQVPDAYTKENRVIYEGSVYRPPSEARSLIIQATIGCANNTCTFCSMYKDKDFRIKSLDEIISDLRWARNAYPYVNRIFLADGDALILPMDSLSAILNSCKDLFPECERVSIYATPQDVLRKTDEDLRELFEMGLKIAYIGAESGSDAVLEKIKKGCSRDEIIEAIRKIEKSGMEASVTFISGLGGKELSVNHAEMTGQMISEAKPTYVGLLTLMIEPSAPMYDDLKSGAFELLDAREVAIETALLLENIETDTEIVFRSNHASNYVSLKGTLPRDKQAMIDELNNALKNETFKDDMFRLL